MAPHRIVNIGNAEPVNLLDFIERVEHNLGKKAQKNMLPMQPGDVEATYADVSLLEALIGFCPGTNASDGIAPLLIGMLNIIPLNLRRNHGNL